MPRRDRNSNGKRTEITSRTLPIDHGNSGTRANLSVSVFGRRLFAFRYNFERPLRSDSKRHSIKSGVFHFALHSLILATIAAVPFTVLVKLGALGLVLILTR